jgi:hypothetical protein
MDMWSTRRSTSPTPSVRLNGGLHSQSRCRVGTSPERDLGREELGLSLWNGWRMSAGDLAGALPACACDGSFDGVCSLYSSLLRK